MTYNETGRTMIEMIGVLAIAGIISAGGLVGFSKVLHKYKQKQTIEFVSVISSSMSAFGAKMDDYSGLNNTSIIKLGIIPGNYIARKPDGTGEILSPFNTPVNITAANLYPTATGATPDSLAYTIQITGLDRQSCLVMAASDYGSGDTSSFVGVAIHDGSVAYSDVNEELYKGCEGFAPTFAKKMAAGCYKGSTVSVPISVATASSVCDCDGSNSCQFIIKFF